MKAQFTVCFPSHGIFARDVSVTRGRVAYLLRAARSRKLDRIDRCLSGYFVHDSALLISRA